MKAIVIGATGATGTNLIEQLILDNDFTEIVIFSRRKINIQHYKITTHIIDFNQIPLYKSLINGEVLFSCLGTTLKDAGSKEIQRKIDFQYQLDFAKIASENNIPNYVLVSSAYANSKSVFFYSKIKGELEDQVKKLNFQKLIIFNPPSLIRKGSNRKLEVLAIKIIKLCNAINILNSLKPLETKKLAIAMIKALKTLPKGVHNINNKQINKLNS